MASKKMPKQSDSLVVPTRLDDHPFFGLRLDEEQKRFRDAIWDEDTEIVFVDAKAGSGKTTVAVGTAILLHQYNRYSDVVYIMHSVGDAQGYLPGNLSEKSCVWFEGLYQALIRCNEFPDRAIRNTSLTAEKNGTGFINAVTTTYLRGSNLSGVVIIDEAQNFPEPVLRKVLTRTCEGSKVIVIGHRLQCDLIRPQDSGFVRCMEHFRAKNNPRFAFCELSTCHRSLVAQVADEDWR